MVLYIGAGLIKCGVVRSRVPAWAARAHQDPMTKI